MHKYDAGMPACMPCSQKLSRTPCDGVAPGRL